MYGNTNNVQSILYKALSLKEMFFRGFPAVVSRNIRGITAGNSGLERKCKGCQGCQTIARIDFGVKITKETSMYLNREKVDFIIQTLQ